MMTYDDKRYLDLDGLTEVFSLLKDTYITPDDVVSLTSDEIVELYCKVCGCTTDEPAESDFDGKTIDISWGGGTPVEIEPTGEPLDGIKVTVNEERAEVDSVDVLKTVLRITLEEEVNEGVVKVSIPRGIIRIVETGEINGAETYEMEVAQPIIRYTIRPGSDKLTPFYFNDGTTVISNEYNEETGEWEALLSGYPTSVGDKFCSYNATNKAWLKTIDLSALKNVESIGDEFCAGCRELVSIDLSPLSKVKTIGANFVSGNYISVDISPLKSVESIGDYFLAGTSIETIDLASLSKIKEIGNSFLESCSYLKTVDLSPLSEVTSIGNDFLKSCYAIKSIDFKGFEKVTSIGNNFLNDSETLENVDFSALTSLQTIGDWFLSECPELKTINLNGLENVKTIGVGFLESLKIENIDWSPLANVERVDASFLYGYGCSQIDLSPLLKLEYVGDYFMMDSQAESIILPSNIKEIGRSFLDSCSHETIDLSPLAYVTKIGDYFLTGNYNLIEVDLTPLWNLTSMGDNMLQSCSDVKTIRTNAFVNKISSGVLKNLEELWLEADSVLPFGNAANNFNPDVKIWVMHDFYSGYQQDYPTLANNFWCIDDGIQHVEAKAMVTYRTIDGQPFEDDKFVFNDGIEIVSHDSNGDGEWEVKLSDKPTEIGDGFLYFMDDGDGRLQTINFQNFDEVTKIGMGFLAGNGYLESIDFGQFPNLTEIDEMCLAGCQGNFQINLTPLSELRTIGYGFAFMSGVEFVELVGLEKLETIGDAFCQMSGNLHEISIADLTSLTSIGSYFLHGTPIETLVFHGNFPNFTEIKEDCLGSYPQLRSVDLTGLAPSLETSYQAIPVQFRECMELRSVKIETPMVCRHVVTEMFREVSPEQNLTIYVDEPLVEEYRQQCPDVLFEFRSAFEYPGEF